MLKPIVEEVDGGAETAFGEAARTDSDRRRRARGRRAARARASAARRRPASRPASTRVPSETTVTPSARDAAAVAARQDRRALAAARRSSRAMYSTIGVLPLPPTRRLPTLMTGRSSRRRRDGSRAYHCAPPRGRRAVRPRSSGLESMHQAEGTDDRAAAPPSRGGSSSAITASVLSLAPRLASTSARAAAPSRARRTGSVTQREQRVVELALRLHLDRRVVGEERARRSP